MGQTMLRVGSILGFYVFPLVLAAVGLAKTLLFLTIVPAIGLIALLPIRWEPIGQDVEEMPETEAVAAVLSGEDPSPPSGGEADSPSLEDKEEPG